MPAAILYDAKEVARADHLVIFVPGVLSSIQIFDAAKPHLPKNTASAYYRFPGLDGVPLAPALQVDLAAREIALLADTYPNHELTLVGYSGGAAIVLEASQLLGSPRAANLALISPTPPFGGGLETRLRTTRDVLAVSVRLGTLDISKIWPEYWKVLAFGWDNYRSGARAEEVERLLERERSNIVIPRREIAKAHTQSLQRWELSSNFDARRLRIGVFYGAKDPVFSEKQTEALIQQLGGAERTQRYPDQGHIPIITEPRLFEDIFDFVR
ncbi:alpha/beta hydrolase [uncultured Tateyamaria sp.]|uniref:alpha/beta fold hydrolase n=1 Tax=Tateyamaria sp. 1078 TaxID=3417464 RepID=UPI002634C8BF|nr:alpha/beta hydrolase [uncultured Tateyamaria sp.]